MRTKGTWGGVSGMADPDEVVVAGGTITSKPVNGMRLRMRAVEW